MHSSFAYPLLTPSPNHHEHFLWCLAEGDHVQVPAWRPRLGLGCAGDCAVCCYGGRPAAGHPAANVCYGVLHSELGVGMGGASGMRPVQQPADGHLEGFQFADVCSRAWILHPGKRSHMQAHGWQRKQVAVIALRWGVPLHTSMFDKDHTLLSSHFQKCRVGTKRVQACPPHSTSA